MLVKGFGVRQIGAPEPVDAHTLFPLASLSKPITSTVLAVVVGEGQAGWDDPATNQLPEFRLGPPAIAASVTLRDLLSHRSGLGDHASDPLEDLGFDRATILKRLSLQPLGNRFRASHAYFASPPPPWPWPANRAAAGRSWPPSASREAPDPSSERSGFYGLGWGVNVTDQGAV